MATGTPHLERIKAAVLLRFRDAIFGQYNCRRRNGWNWSQHAGSEPAEGYRGNAVDIVHKDHGYGDKSPAHQAWLDRVNAFLVQNREALELNELIWRKRNHFDHIHTSPWPKLYDAGLYKPPCEGGNLIVVHKGGRRGATFQVPAPPPPPPTSPTLEDEMLPLRYGDGFVDGQQLTYPTGHPQAGAQFTTDRFYKRSDVRAIQGMLRDAGVSVNTDGEYTVKTAEAIMVVTPTTGADSNGFEFHGNDWAPTLKAAYGRSGNSGNLSRGDTVTLN